MKVSILTYLDSETATEYDMVADQIAAALRKKGYQPSILPIHGDIRKLLTGLGRRKPELIFNVMESFAAISSGAVGIVGLLTLRDIPFTGGGPGEFYLQEDKSLTKKLLKYEGIGYPDFAVFGLDSDLETGGNLRMPLFVKPLRMDGSVGIDGKALVHTALDMMKQVVSIHQKVQDAALVEEFIEGREFHVGVLGNQQPLAFPPIEIDFSKMPEGAARVLDAKAKWDEKSAEFKGSTSIVAEVPDELRAKLQKVAVDAFRALRVRDYGRVDLRLTDTGDIYVIEVNASCYLEQSSEFAMGAAAAGIDYPTLIDRIVRLAMERYKMGEPKLAKKKAPRKRKAKRVAETVG